MVVISVGAVVVVVGWRFVAGAVVAGELIVGLVGVRLVFL